MKSFLAALLALSLEAPSAPSPRYEATTGWVVSEKGHRIKTVLTRPAGVKGRLPAVMLVPWLSCDPVDPPGGPSAGDGFSILMARLAEESGFATYRVEKPGLAGSEGPPCADCDFETELAGYRAGLAALRREAGIDPDAVFLLGTSNGGGVAPLVARGQKVRGYVVTGGWGRTWYEHMLEEERVRLSLSGLAPSEVSRRIKAVAELYTRYLIRGETPGTIVRERPELKAAWEDEPGRQYGRPAAFYQQLQALELAAEWEKVTSPVLVLSGEFDFIMSRADQEAITAAVNFRHPGLARFVSIPRMDHLLCVHDDLGKAFHGGRGRFHQPLVKLVIDWMKECLGSAASR